ncbi:MAG TPA: hypothetical protein VLJ59_20625 [Mycobacteriales bacterium]|nr:hypothetical protein [Mycobacteriales bacterium]
MTDQYPFDPFEPPPPPPDETHHLVVEHRYGDLSLDRPMVIIGFPTLADRPKPLLRGTETSQQKADEGDS